MTEIWLRSKNLPETDIIKGFVIDTVGLISVLNQLMNGECGVVRLKYTLVKKSKSIEKTPTS